MSRDEELYRAVSLGASLAPAASAPEPVSPADNFWAPAATAEERRANADRLHASEVEAYRALFRMKDIKQPPFGS